jgi:hypothetical protein
MKESRQRKKEGEEQARRTEEQGKGREKNHIIVFFKTWLMVDEGS